MPPTAIATDPIASMLLIVALVLATVLYAALLRRRHAAERLREHSLSSIVENYGRSGIPDSFLNR